jgi:hypothetical protein
MQTELLVAVASRMLVRAVVVFALPSPVQAETQPQWCFILTGNIPICEKNKGLCLQREKVAIEAGTLESNCAEIS